MLDSSAHTDSASHSGSFRRSLSLASGGDRTQALMDFPLSDAAGWLSLRSYYYYHSLVLSPNILSPFFGKGRAGDLGTWPASLCYTLDIADEGLSQSTWLGKETSRAAPAGGHDVLQMGLPLPRLSHQHTSPPFLLPRRGKRVSLQADPEGLLLISPPAWARPAMIGL